MVLGDGAQSPEKAMQEAYQMAAANPEIQLENTKEVIFQIRLIFGRKKSLAEKMCPKKIFFVQINIFWGKKILDRIFGIHKSVTEFLA